MSDAGQVSQVTRTPNGRRSYDRDAAEAARTATLESMHAQLVERVSSLDSSQEWGAWLRFANSFHQYSFNNTVLIWAQKPEATMVAGYRAWQAKGRQVRRGEAAIRVLGPVTARQPRLDDHGRRVTGEDGKPVQEVRVVGVKPVSVFDVSQTDGDPLPEPPQAQMLTGQAPAGLWDALQTFVESRDYTVSRGDCPDGANGATMFDQRQVLVRADVDDAQAVKTLAHEAGHVLMHPPEQREPFACRGIVEVEAESVAFMVTAAHGLDSSQYTFNYLTGWAHQAAAPDGPSVEDLVRATGQRVITAADQILQATQRSPTLVDRAVSDLAVHATRPLDTVTAELRPVDDGDSAGSGRTRVVVSTVDARTAVPAAVWERVASPRLDGAARQRREITRPPTGPAPTLRR